MKKIFIPITVLALSLVAFGAPQANAVDLGIKSDTSVNVETNNNSMMQKNRIENHMNTETDSENSMGYQNKAMNEKDRLQNINKAIMQRRQDFKQNLAKIKTAPIGEKKTFIVNAYTDAYTFLTKTHDQFVTALNTAEAKGIDVTEARAHFATAWNILTTANVDLQSFTKIDVQTASATDMKTVAKKIEAEYIKVRQEMHAGAESFRVAIKAHETTSASTTVNSQ